MSKLSADRVNETTRACLFDQADLVDGKPPEGRLVVGDSIVRKFGFDKERVELQKPAIAEMLLELADDFYLSKGGGMSFLQACMDRNGNHWAEHPAMGELFALGEAAGLSKCLMPREMWSALPGGMPYYAVLDSECKALLEPIQVS